jgi:tRNA(Ile)-lysidine synthase
LKSLFPEAVTHAGEQLHAHLKLGVRILVAVSGGPDSVALAHFLRGQPYPLVIGHVDHQLRKGSASDARFVQRLARQWDVPCLVTRVPVRAHAKKHHLGIEEAARDLRYRALSVMAKRARCAAIVTAHTANDQAETVLMNFLRGAGPSGLAGMPVARQFDRAGSVPIVRPFLGITRSQILQAVRRHSLPFRQDPSNRSQRFRRNRIRHAVLPFLERLYPGLAGRLVQGADIFRQEEAFWQDVVLRECRETMRKSGGKTRVVLPRLLRYHKALSRRILRHALPGLSFQEIDRILFLARSTGRSGRLDFFGGRRVQREKNQLVIIWKRIG